MKVSNCKASTGKILLFWVGGRLWEMLAYKRWSHVEVQLYYYYYYIIIIIIIITLLQVETRDWIWRQEVFGHQE